MIAEAVGADGGSSDCGGGEQRLGGGWESAGSSAPDHWRKELSRPRGGARGATAGSVAGEGRGGDVGRSGVEWLTKSYSPPRSRAISSSTARVTPRRSHVAMAAATAAAGSGSAAAAVPAAAAVAAACDGGRAAGRACPACRAGAGRTDRTGDVSGCCVGAAATSGNTGSPACAGCSCERGGPAAHSTPLRANVLKLRANAAWPGGKSEASSEW